MVDGNGGLAKAGKRDFFLGCSRAHFFSAGWGVFGGGLGTCSSFRGSDFLFIGR